MYLEDENEYSNLLKELKISLSKGDSSNHLDQWFVYRKYGLAGEYTDYSVKLIYVQEFGVKTLALCTWIHTDFPNSLDSLTIQFANGIKVNSTISSEVQLVRIKSSYDFMNRSILYRAEYDSIISRFKKLT